MIEILQADITTLHVDAVVNAANSTLLGGGGVDGTIHRAAGPELREACRLLGDCPTGEAKITPGFQLPAEWVIHTVGPVWRGGRAGEPRLLEGCYRRAFQLARQHGVSTIAFPSISTGAYGYPKRDAALIAVTVMREYEDRFERITACCIGEEDRRIYEAVVHGA
jgi:O-acetyl-ADP-ribose deacetylase (regulator of RNase III)